MGSRLTKEDGTNNTAIQVNRLFLLSNWNEIELRSGEGKRDREGMDLWRCGPTEYLYSRSHLHTTPPTFRTPPSRLPNTGAYMTPSFKWLVDGASELVCTLQDK